MKRCRHGAALAALFCWLGQMAGAEMAKLFEDFGPGASARWTYVADGVMGGVSSGAADFLMDPSAIRLTGQVSTENNGGFIQVRRRFEGGWPAGAQALRLSVRGNGETYYVFLRTSGLARVWHSYRHSFETSAQWQDVVLPFDSFTPSHDGMPSAFRLEDVGSLGIVAYGRDHDADVSVRAITLE